MSNRQEVIDFIKKHKIDKFPLFYDNKDFVGYLTDELKYKKDAYAPYLTATGTKADEVAMSIAIENMPIVTELYEKWNTEMELVVEYYNDYKKSREEVFKGTLDSIFEQLDKANNRLRYCNGSYYNLADKHYETLMMFWFKYIPFSRSFNNFYLGSFVD